MDTPPTTPPPPRACISCGAHAASSESPLCAACRRALPGLQVDPDVPDEPFVVTGRTCADCGYDLTTLRSDRECPECGTPVIRSLRGNLLRFSDPAYVRLLHRGMLFAELAALLLAICTILSGAATVAVASRNFMHLSGAVTILIQVVTLGVAAFGAYAWWLISSPDPHPLGRDLAIGPRKLIRVALVLELAVYTITLGVCIAVVDFWTGQVSPGGEEAQDAMSLISIMFWLFRFVAAMFYLRTVARRLPDAMLYTNAKALIWVGPLVTIFSCGLGIVVAFIAYVLMLDRFRRRLRDTVPLADRFAATPSP